MANEILAGLIVLILGILVDVIMQLKKQITQHDELLSTIQMQLTNQIKYVENLPFNIQEEKLQSLTEVVHIMKHDAEQTKELLDGLSKQIKSIETSINSITVSVSILEENVRRIKNQLYNIRGDDDSGRT